MRGISRGLPSFARCNGRWVKGPRRFAAALRDAESSDDADPGFHPATPTRKDRAPGTPALGYFRVLPTGELTVRGSRSPMSQNRDMGHPSFVVRPAPPANVLQMTSGVRGFSGLKIQTWATRHFINVPILSGCIIVLALLFGIGTVEV